MSNNTTMQKFSHVLSFWEKALDDYTEEELLKKPSEDSWSIGQVYMHLLQGTLDFHATTIEKCLSNNENAKNGKTMPGKIVFLIKGFPPTKIKVSPSVKGYTPVQPENKANVKALFPVLLHKMTALNEAIKTSDVKGKTQHPALGYLSAKEWFQLIEMHFRHHKRQKTRIDTFLHNQK